MFVNMPDAERNAAPESTLVRATDIPVITDSKRRIRVVLGEYQGVQGATISKQPTTLLDASIANGGIMVVQPRQGEHTWIYVFSGSLNLQHGDDEELLSSGNAIALGSSSSNIKLSAITESKAHLVIVSAAAINEPFLQAGPFAMRDKRALNQAQERYQHGQFGHLE